MSARPICAIAGWAGAGTASLVGREEDGAVMERRRLSEMTGDPEHYWRVRTVIEFTKLGLWILWEVAKDRL